MQNKENQANRTNVEEAERQKPPAPTLFTNEEEEERFPTLTVPQPRPTPPAPPPPPTETPIITTTPPSSATPKRRGRPRKQASVPAPDLPDPQVLQVPPVIQATPSPQPGSRYELRSQFCNPMPTQAPRSDKPVILVPQILRPPPITPPEGGGNEIVKEIDAVNSGWTVVERKRNKRQLWNAAQKNQFLMTGDVYKLQSHDYEDSESEPTQDEEAEIPNGEELEEAAGVAQQDTPEINANSESEGELQTLTASSSQTTPAPRSDQNQFVLDDPDMLWDEAHRQARRTGTLLPGLNPYLSYLYTGLSTRSRSSAPALPPIPRVPPEQKTATKKREK